MLLGREKKKNKIEIFLFVLFIFFAILVGTETFYFNRLKKQKANLESENSYNQEETKIEVYYPSPKIVNISSESFSPPVDKNYQKKGKKVQMDAGFDDWGGLLPKGEGIYAGFEGKVQVNGAEDGVRVIILDDLEGKRRWRYWLIGKVLVSTGQTVKKGEKIAEAGEVVLPSFDVNLIVQEFEAGKRVSLNWNLQD